MCVSKYILRGDLCVLNELLSKCYIHCVTLLMSPTPGPSCLFPQYAKLSLSLRVPGGGKKTKAGGSEVTAGQTGPGEEEDEYAGGLC